MEKRKLAELCDWLESLLDADHIESDYLAGANSAFEKSLSKAKSLLAQEQAQNPTVKDIEIKELRERLAAQIEINISKPMADGGLVEELRKWMDGFQTVIDHFKDEEKETYCFFTKKDVEEFNKIISKFTTVKPVDTEKDFRETLEKLARLGNGTEYGNSDGNVIAQEALARHSQPVDTEVKP